MYALDIMQYDAGHIFSCQQRPLPLFGKCQCEFRAFPYFFTNLKPQHFALSLYLVRFERDGCRIALWSVDQDHDLDGE